MNRVDVDEASSKCLEARKIILNVFSVGSEVIMTR